MDIKTKKKLINFNFLREFLFSFMILLASGPTWGQTNNGIDASLEGDRLLLEIDIKILDKPILFVRHDIGHHQVIWSKQRDHILLTIPQIHSLSGTIIPLYNDYHIKTNIIGRFPIIKNKSTTQSFYIDVTDLLLQADITWNMEGPETTLINQSYIENIGYLKNEILITTKRTILRNNKVTTINADFSFFMLPDPMKPRLFDHRMGYFCEDMYSVLNDLPNTEKGSIMRWRLEKKYKNRRISEPVRPIIFYLDPAIPDKWKPYIKAGVLEWLPAFEAAGFKNAIEVREVPKNDKNWFRNSVKNSIIRWSNYTEVRGSQDKGGSTVRQIVDLRSGEILKSDIIIGSSYQSLSDRYLVRCAPMDKRAQQYPFPDDLLGELFQFVTAHEAGHAFGLKDANYGEYAYPFEKMRNESWLRKMGHTPSIMSYARHNHIVQPKDSIPPSLLVQKVGPMDIYQIKWGYQTIPGTNRPEEELHYLEKIVREQDSVPWYRCNIGSESLGPGSTNEVVDNDDPVQSIRLSLKNLKKVIELLPSINQSQRDNALLERLYNKSLDLWYHQMSQVMSLIGGYTLQYKSGAQPGEVYTPIPPKVQEEAMEFLLLNAFEVPEWLSNPTFLPRIRFSTNSDRLMEYQLKLLSELITPFRMKRIEQMENSVLHNEISKKLLSKLRLRLFNELKSDDVLINRHRQELQSAYLGLLVKAVNQERKYENIILGENYYLYSDYSKSIFMSELHFLKKEITDCLKMVKDESTLGHLKLCLWQINNLLK
ncbi:MAG: hypothetical protein CVU01_01920 [Bacteroidetes bacterium HGW-Bacteroidetes-18]|nr:MAG: hypothetical protein CVU01_01920 [Bacteroidetes bacterium HGW-Bacteroidetes-18]